jgi:hypothetical protein|tara:strand:+ start:1478 stop:2251 length:774 start_codon:yes stop_codon:yes gene_type:complete
MAINVDNVYKTVLLVLNKEQRGYMTPDEFNKTATQVQLDIFEQYFDDLNQQLRVPQTDLDYSNRQVDIDSKLALFKCFGFCDHVPQGTIPYFQLPQFDLLRGGTPVVYDDNPNTAEFAFYKLGTVSVGENEPIEAQRLQRADFYSVERSDLTAPTVNFPVYLYESGKIYVKPDSVAATKVVQTTFLRKPRNVVWNFISTSGYYEFVTNGSYNFELETSEQVNVITRILLYAGVVISDPTIIQVASGQIQQEKQNSKS